MTGVKIAKAKSQSDATCLIAIKSEVSWQIQLCAICHIPVWSVLKLSRIDEILPKLLICPTSEILIGVSVETMIKALRRSCLLHIDVWSLELFRFLNEIILENINFAADLQEYDWLISDLDFQDSRQMTL